MFVFFCIFYFHLVSCLHSQNAPCTTNHLLHTVPPGLCVCVCVCRRFGSREDSLVEGRLYRSGTRFSSEQLHQHTYHQQLMDDGSDSEHLVASVSSPPPPAMLSQTDADSDTADPHRTSFVKFAEDSDGDDEKETAFVRQNTPHPKDLKAKAQKHFKGKKIDGKVVHHDEQDGLLKDGEAFKPERTGGQEVPYRRTSPLPPLQLIDLPDRDEQHASRSASGYTEQYEQTRPTSSPSPVTEPIEKAVAFVDQHEHRSIEEEDENEEVIDYYYSSLFLLMFVRGTCADWLSVIFPNRISTVAMSEYLVKSPNCRDAIRLTT